MGLESTCNEVLSISLVCVAVRGTIRDHFVQRRCHRQVCCWMIWNESSSPTRTTSFSVDPSVYSYQQLGRPGTELGAETCLPHCYLGSTIHSAIKQIIEEDQGPISRHGERTSYARS